MLLHAVSGQSDMKCQSGEQFTLQLFGPSVIHAACYKCLGPFIVFPLDQIWNFIFQVVTQGLCFVCEIQSRDHYLFYVVGLFKW